MALAEEATRLLIGRGHQLPQTRETLNGNRIDRSTCTVLGRRWRLGIFPLAPELANSQRSCMVHEARVGSDRLEE